MSARALPSSSAFPARAGAAAVGLSLAVVLAYVLGTGQSGSAVAAPTNPGQSGSATAGVEVLGVGKVAGTPDVLRLNLAITVTRADAGGSLAAVSATARKVIAALKARRVDSKDIQTANLSLQPEYDYTQNRQVLKGYTATEGISVVLRDLTKAGSAITAATTAGGDATRIQGVALDLEGDSALLSQARDAAIADARTKATAYAKAAGRELGVVTVISENSTPSTPLTLDSRLFAMSESKADVPVEPGSQQVSVNVRVVWSFA